MISLFLTVLIGAAAYAAVQFLWYAPFVFGSTYLRGTSQSEDEVVGAVAKPGRSARIISGIVLPAFLSSAVLSVLQMITDRIFGTRIGFLLLVLVMGLSISFSKHLFGLLAGRRPDKLAFIQDGAFFCGLLSAAFAIVGSSADLF